MKTHPPSPSLKSVWTTHIVYRGLHTWYTGKKGKFMKKNYAFCNKKYHESEN
jgi:hypothetical protein